MSPDFVVIGHVTLDRFGDVTRPGGAALYAAVTAHRLGLSVGLLTSHANDFPLELLPPQIEVVSVQSDETTTFEVGSATEGRVLTLCASAEVLGPADVPEDWRDAPIVLLAPVADEVDPLIATAFDDAALGAAAQGWLRGVGPDGIVIPQSWELPEPLTRSLQALFVSTEDIEGQEEEIVEWFQRLPLVVVTAGREGALLFVNGDRYEVWVRPVDEVDATGAGDVFAATFLVRYHLEGNPWEAAAAATCAAALSVGGEGWSHVPDRAMLEAALVSYRRQRDDPRSLGDSSRAS